jgi:SAM-dependent methyltransferase
VVLTDFAEPMVRAAAAGKARLGLDNVETRVLDAERGSFDDEPFDVVLCRFGFMLMNDPLKALRASAAALVPEGKLVLAVWGSAEENPWLSTILTSFMDHFDAPPPEPDTPGPFRLGEPDRLRYLLERGGFREVAIERLEGEQTYDSPEGWWNDVLAVSGPLAAAFGSLPDDDARSIRDRALARAPLRVAEDGSVRFPAVMLGAEATRR